jgi:glycosyltransferase involved in cell wall biosynthesis
VKVLHVLAELNHSGAERMLVCSAEQWHAAGVEAIVAGMANGSHRFSANLMQAGFEVLLLPDARSLRGLRGLAGAIRTYKPQVVHVHAERCFDLVSLVAATSPSVEAVVRTVHSHFLFTGGLRLRRRFRIRLADFVGVSWVACSPEVAENERSYLANRSLSLVRNWIDVDGVRDGATAEAGAALRDELGIEPDALVLALIGNCGGAKNHEFVPHLLARIEQPVHILHVGEQRNSPQAETRAWEMLDDRHRAHHLGKRDDVPALLAASDQLLLPSLYEGYPLVAMEALCASVPILASDVPGMRWLRDFGSAKLLPLDRSHWSTAVLAQLASESAKRAAVQAAAVAQENFGPEAGVARYLEVYRSAPRPGWRFPQRQRGAPSP